MQEKRIDNGSSVQIENFVTRITFRHHSASLMMPNITLVTELSISTSQPLKILIVLHDNKVRPLVTHFFPPQTTKLPPPNRPST